MNSLALDAISSSCRDCAPERAVCYGVHGGWVLPSPDGPQMNSGFTIVVCDPATFMADACASWFERAYDEVFKGVVLYVIAPFLTFAASSGSEAK